MIGAIIGDIVGSVYEFHTIKQKEFKLLKPKCQVTDDTIMTCAIAKACIDYLDNKNINSFKEKCIIYMQELGRKYKNAGYGYNFNQWLMDENPQPYNSYGNGGAMRTSPVAYVAESLEEVELLAKAQAEVSHNHEEGIKGAQAIASAMYMSLNGKTKEEIKEYIEKKYYKLDFTIKDIRRKYKYDISAQGSVPEAIESFLEGENYEDSIRNAICLGGDADTLACMTGAISECFYGLPDNIDINPYLNDELKEIINNFYNKIKKKNNLSQESQNKRI